MTRQRDIAAALKRAQKHHAKSNPPGVPNHIILGVGDMSVVGDEWIGRLSGISEEEARGSLEPLAQHPEVRAVTVEAIDGRFALVRITLTGVMHRKEFMALLGRLATTSQFDIRKWSPV